jgi:hypothetical protein
MKEYFASREGSIALWLWAGESIPSQPDFTNLSFHVSNGEITPLHSPQKIRQHKKTQ